jgi:hypothetical protein
VFAKIRRVPSKFALEVTGSAWYSGLRVGIFGCFASDSTLRSFLKHQVAKPRHIVSRHRKGESLSNTIDATKASLSISANGLHPAENHFHPLANPLTDSVANMPRSPSVYRGGGLALGNVRSSIQLAKVLHTGTSIVASVHTNGDSVVAGGRTDHLYGSLRLSCGRADAHVVIHDQPVAILHQHMAHVALSRFSSQALFRPAGVGVRRGGVCFVAPPLPPVVDVFVSLARDPSVPTDLPPCWKLF